MVSFLGLSYIKKDLSTLKIIGCGDIRDKIESGF